MTYDAKYVVKKATRDAFKTIEDGEEISLRISADAKELFYEFLDTAVLKAIDVLIEDGLPRKTRGENKGKLRRITLMPEDVPSLETLKVTFEKVAQDDDDDEEDAVKEPNAVETSDEPPKERDVRVEVALNEMPE